MKVTIRLKLMGLVALMLVAMLIVGGTAYMGLQSIGAEITEIAEEDIPLTNSLTLITEYQLEQTIVFEQL